MAKRSKFTLEALAPELEKVLTDRTVVSSAITVQEAYFIMQGCQLAHSHPQLHAPMKDRFLALGHRMQELIRPHVSEFFCEFMQAGWDRKEDR